MAQQHARYTDITKLGAGFNAANEAQRGDAPSAWIASKGSASAARAEATCTERSLNVSGLVVPMAAYDVPVLVSLTGQNRPRHHDDPSDFAVNR